jgi:hypothetical protein
MSTYPSVDSIEPIQIWQVYRPSGSVVPVAPP